MLRLKNFIGTLRFPKIEKKTFFSLITVLILLAGMATSFYLVQKNQDIRKKATANQTLVTFVPSATNVIPGGTFTVDVFLNPPAPPEPLLEITAAGIIVSYPDNLVALQNITPGNFFIDNFVGGQTEMMALGISCTQPTDCTKYTQATNITCLNNFCQNSAYPLNNANGQAKIYLGAPCHINLPTDGTPGCYTENTTKKFATLTFQAKTGVSGSANISLAQGSEIAAKNQTASVLNPSLPSITININAVTPTNTPTQTPTNTPVPTATRTPTPTNTPVPTNTPIPTSVPTNTLAPTPTTAPNTANLSFTVKFQGIASKKPDKNLRLTFKNTGTTPLVYENINTTSNDQGVYSGVVQNIPPGTYEILVKGPVHLQKNFGSVTFTAGQTETKDWTQFALIRGDTNNDNWIKLNDITGIIAAWTSSETPVNDANRKFDLDENGIISISDITAIISNWNASEVEGDK